MQKVIIFLLFPTLMLLFSACRKELEEPVPDGEQGWTTVHLRATVSGDLKTKATLDDDDRHYLFERDDLLYVVNKNSGRELYGFLYLISGAGATTAVFEGDLMYFNPSTSEPEEPDSGFAISATLVSAAQRAAGVFTTVTGNDGKLTSMEPAYGNAVAGTFKEAVQLYSHFTGDATFGNPSFSLSQQSAFVIFQFSFDNDLGSGDLSFTMNNGGSAVRTMTVTPDVYKRAGFVAAFPNGTALSSANVTVTGGGLGGGTGVQRDLRNATLQSNKYYNVNQCYVDLTYFTIQAGAAATDITFNYKTSHGVQYSTDGSTWTAVGNDPVPVAAGSSIKVRGTGSKYKDSGTLFTSTADCDIYGDIMSLFYTDNTYSTKKTALAANALQGAFMGLTNIDIPPGRPLLLSATTLSNNCYQQMFSGCTGLTYAPEFRNENGQSASTIPNYACQEMFLGCTSLTEAPELPATSVGQNGYIRMFKNCSALETPPISLAQNITGASACEEMFRDCVSLRYAPELPAMSIPNRGYYAMFSGCTSLIAAPELPATQIGERAYNRMFGSDTDAGNGCSSMVTGPSTLPATGMKIWCYSRMFTGCTSLENAPEIMATGTLAEGCFNEMFKSCSRLRSAQTDFYFSTVGNNSCKQMFMSCLALNNAPNMPNVTGTIGTNGCQDMYNNCGEMATAPGALNASTVGENGYYQMFYNCLKIKDAPSISATNVGNNGCYRMFYGCTRLQTPPVELPATTLASQAYREMFYGCKALKSAPTFPTEDATFGGDNVCYQMFYTCITIPELTGQLFGAGTILKSSCFNQMFYGCSSLKTVPEDFLPATSLASNCFNSMFYGTAIVRAPNLPATTLASNCYQNMFRDCTYLNTVPQNCLPATTLASSCYQEMFRGCTSLTTAPDLPATTLASSCYQGMFYSTKLTQSPSLPATTLADNCYKEMFRGCTSLTTAPVLPATTLTSSCYQGMFYGSGLTQAPSLPAETLANNCYREMFQSCASLTTAPVLPATTLATSCYQGMFYSTGLTQAPSLPAETLAANCYQYMFRGCTSLTTAPNLPATTLAANCYQEMFRGCSSLTTAPDLPATTLASSCYQGMFYSSKLTQSPLLPAETLEANCYKEMFRDCKSLNQITCLATTISATDCLKDWVNAVAAAGTFVKAASATSWPTGVSGIPSGWTVGDYTPPTP